jgi:hypothetical protein
VDVKRREKCLENVLKTLSEFEVVVDETKHRQSAAAINFILSRISSILGFALGVGLDFKYEPT